MIGLLAATLFAGFFTAMAMRFIEPPVSSRVVTIVTVGVMILVGSCSLIKNDSRDPFSGWDCSHSRFC